MRTLLGGELTTALAWDTDTYVKLEVQNGSGTWINVDTAFGKSSILQASWGEHVNTPVSQAKITLVQKIGSNSLAPFLESSPLNVDDVAAYSPLLELGRGVRLYSATMAKGVTLDTGKYRKVFEGRIDDIEQTDNVRGMTPIVITCSDLGAWLMDMQIEGGTTRYGASTGSPLETVIQGILDDNIPVGEPSVTLLKTSSSNFAVTAYDQDESKVFEGILKLVLDSTGEDVRYRFDSSHVSQFTWFNPDRSRVTVDATISTYNLEKLDTSIANIRNAGELPYTDVDTGDSGSVSSADVASQAKYRRRFFRMPISPLLTTEAEAQAVIDAVVNDLSGAEADFQADCPYLWFVQLFDRYTFPANDRNYDDDQTYGVVGYEHTIENGRGQTSIQCAGRIVGAYAEWLKRIPNTVDDPVLDIQVPPLLSYTVRTEIVSGVAHSYLTAKVQGGAGTYRTRAAASIHTSAYGFREPTGDELDATTASTAGLRTGVFEDLIELKAGKRFYLVGRAYNEVGEGTAIAHLSEVWLGIDSTPGADVTIGTVTSMADQIIYPVAFDDECAYCEVWTREFTSNPGSTYSVEDLSNAPYRVLSLGDDAMVPGIEFDLSIPIAHPDNWLLVTFVPFDHLGKRGNVKHKKNKGSRGEIDDPGGPEGMESLLLWIDASQEGFAENDDVDTATDFSGNGHDMTCSQGTAFQPKWSDGQTPAGTPVFDFITPSLSSFSGDLNTDNAVNEPEYLRTATTLAIPTDGMTVFLVARRDGAHVEHTVFYRGADNTGQTPWVKEEDAGAGVYKVKWDPTGAIITPSDTTEFFIHAVRFESTSLARQYYNAEQAGSTWDPVASFDSATGFMLGGGNLQIAEFIVFEGALTDVEMNDIFAYLSDKHFNGTVDPPLGTAPDPPSVVLVSETTSSITVDVTMPASAPDSIRITINGLHSYDETVTVAGSATQTIVIGGSLNPDTTYVLDFRSVDAGLTSTKVSLIVTTDAVELVALDTPTDPDVAYSEGDQTVIVRVQPGANNPSLTEYHVETSSVTGGPYAFRAFGYDDGFGGLITFGVVQFSSAYTLYMRAWAVKTGWTDSSKMTEFSVEIPAR